MPNLNPHTLAEETEEETLARQCQTGVIGNGHTVECHPTGEADVKEMKSRAVCLVRPYPTCGACAHSNFKLIFNADPNAKLQQVLCPRWQSEADRSQGKKPTEYVTTELLTCGKKPFEFCPSCPSMERLSQMFIDKKKDGWYSRFKRFKELQEEEERE